MQISKRLSQSSDRKIELLLKVKQCEHQIREEIRLVLSALFRVTEIFLGQLESFYSEKLQCKSAICTDHYLHVTSVTKKKNIIKLSK